MLSLMTNLPKRKNDVNLGRKFKSSKWGDQMKFLMVSTCPHELIQKIDLKLGEKILCLALETQKGSHDLSLGPYDTMNGKPEGKLKQAS